MRPERIRCPTRDPVDVNGIRVPRLPAWVRWAFVVVVAGAVFALSILVAPAETPVDTFQPELLPLDEWRHLVAYAGVAGSLAYATADWNADRWRLAAAVVGVSVCYGLAIEFGRSTLPARYFSVGDAYANALGSLLVLPWYLVRPRLDLVAVLSG